MIFTKKEFDNLIYLVHTAQFLLNSAPHMITRMIFLPFKMSTISRHFVSAEWYQHLHGVLALARDLLAITPKKLNNCENLLTGKFIFTFNTIFQ